jgi:hypothetical protein
MPSITKVGKKWRAKISVNNEQVHIGMFNTKAEAVKACDDAIEFHKNNYIDSLYYNDLIEIEDTPRKSLWQKIKSIFRA